MGRSGSQCRWARRGEDNQQQWRGDEPGCVGLVFGCDRCCDQQRKGAVVAPFAPLEEVEEPVCGERHPEEIGPVEVHRAAVVGNGEVAHGKEGCEQCCPTVEAPGDDAGEGAERDGAHGEREKLREQVDRGHGRVAEDVCRNRIARPGGGSCDADEQHRQAQEAEQQVVEQGVGVTRAGW